MLAHVFCATALAAHLDSAAPVVFLSVALSGRDRRMLAQRALHNALIYGVPLAMWRRWRRGREVRCDMLMAFDPEFESAEILKKTGRAECALEEKNNYAAPTIARPNREDEVREASK